MRLPRPGSVGDLPRPVLRVRGRCRRIGLSTTLVGAPPPAAVTSARAFNCSNASTTIGVTPLGGLADVAAGRVTPPRARMAIALLPGWPLRSPSISRPTLSCKPDGGTPSTWSCTFLVRANAFLGMRVTVSVAAL